MEEITLKEILNVVLDVKQELKQEMQDMKSELREEMQDMKSELREEMQDMKTEMEKMNERIGALEKTQKEIIREQVDTREIIKIIVDKIGEIDRKLDAQAKDKCIFHKTLVGAKNN